jgi:hypothetical protein
VIVIGLTHVIVQEKQRAALASQLGKDDSRLSLELEIAKELQEFQRDSVREKETLERMFRKRADRWEAERQRMEEERLRERAEWEREKLLEREEWERERREWLERVARLSGSRGDEEEEDADDDEHTKEKCNSSEQQTE